MKPLPKLKYKSEAEILADLQADPDLLPNIAKLIFALRSIYGVLVTLSQWLPFVGIPGEKVMQTLVDAAESEAEE